MAIALLITSSVFAQYGSPTINRPADPAPNFSLSAGPYISFNLVEFVEPGFGAYLNMKDIFMVGPFCQRGIRNSNTLVGMYTHVNFIPKEYYLTVGLGARWGTYDFKHLTVEPMFVIQHNNMSDRLRFTHNIGIVGGFPSYSFGVIVGNFGEKWWMHPSTSKLYSKRKVTQARLME